MNYTHVYNKYISQDPDDSDSCIVWNFIPGGRHIFGRGSWGVARSPTPIAGSATQVLVQFEPTTLQLAGEFINTKLAGLSDCLYDFQQSVGGNKSPHPLGLRFVFMRYSVWPYLIHTLLAVCVQTPCKLQFIIFCLALPNAHLVVWQDVRLLRSRTEVRSLRRVRTCYCYHITWANTGELNVLR